MKYTVPQEDLRMVVLESFPKGSKTITLDCEWIQGTETVYIDDFKRLIPIQIYGPPNMLLYNGYSFRYECSPLPCDVVTGTNILLSSKPITFESKFKPVSGKLTYRLSTGQTLVIEDGKAIKIEKNSHFIFGKNKNYLINPFEGWTLSCDAEDVETTDSLIQQLF